MNEAPVQAGDTIKLAMDLHGAAMVDYLNGEHDTAGIMHRDNGFTYPPIVAGRWFYEGGFPIVDSKALALCRGTVLNVGASSGSHSLFLEQQGLNVLSLDASPLAVDVMKRRNVYNPVVGDISSVEGPFDTILLLSGIGVAGTVDGLKRYLEHARTRLKPDGALITDCTHPRADALESSQRYCDLQMAQGRYEGERTLRFEYKGDIGPWFTWLAIAPEVLQRHAREFGFTFQIIYSEVGRSLCALRVRG